jgi:16S rRNA processing protein RimM
MKSNRRRIAARRRNKHAGSPERGEPVFLVVGKLRRPHGLKGEILMGVLTDFPDRLQPDVTVYVGEQHQPYQIQSRREHNKGLLLRFSGFDSREMVAAITNKEVFVRVDDRPPLPEGEYYQHQLIGLQVLTDEGEALGIIAEILETGANDVYVVRAEGKKDVLLPAIDEVVLGIDLKVGEIRVHMFAGLGE